MFAIFTSMAWNMTFAFYHSLVSQPRDLDEAARIMRLTRWQRFWRLDVPSGMIPLVWNGMLSFGGAWFFLAASESISVLNHHYALPGIGSYAAAAIAQANLSHVGLAILVMIVLVIGVNFVFWRPVTAWAERFRVEESESAERPRSLVLDVLRRSQVPEQLGRPLRPVGRLLDRVTRPFGLAEHPLIVSRTRERTGDVFFAGVLAVLVAYGAWEALGYVRATTGLGEFGYAFALGAATFARVIVLVAFATVVWVPIGVWIGMNPKVTRFAQPIVQVLASFPANFLFPFATLRVRGLAHPAQLRRDPADGARRAVVHPVQRHRRRLRDPFGPAGGDDEPPRARLAALEELHPARRSSPATSPAGSPPRAARGTPPSSPRSSATATIT